MTRKQALPVFFVVFLALFLGVVSWGVANDAAQTAQRAKPVAEKFLGDPRATVTLYDYSSLTCPHCARFHNEVLPVLKSEFIDTGKVKLVFRDFPLNPPAFQASVLTHCADPKQYYPLLDALFKNQAQWSTSSDVTASLTAYAVLAGTTKEKFAACLKDEKLQQSILAARLEGQEKYKIDSTPTFIVMPGGAVLKGEQSVDAFRRALNAQIKTK